MAFLSPPVTSHLGGTTYGGFSAVAIAVGRRGRATTVLVSAFTASSMLSPMSTFSFAAASTFPMGTAAAGEHNISGMASVGLLLVVSRTSVVPLSYSAGVVAANTATRCKVLWLHHESGRQGVDEHCIQYVVVEGQSSCTYFCDKILDPTNRLGRLLPGAISEQLRGRERLGLVPVT